MDTIEIEDFFAGLGPVAVRRLFGGKGIYHQGLIVGLVMRGELLLKADAETAPRFEAAGAVQWTYGGRRGKTVRMPYWSVPIDAYDDPEAQTGWVRLAFEAAMRASAT